MISDTQSTIPGRPTRLSVVIPCYNEERTLQRAVERVLDIADDDLSLEIIIVDDGSTDASPAIMRKLADRCPAIQVFNHPRNMGKGAALRTGFQNAAGDFVVVQDADLEYNPGEIRGLLTPLVNGEADVVIGSRFLSPGAHRVLYFWHYMGNRFLTLLSNMFTDLNLTDMESCYKIFRREVLQHIEIEEDRFGFEPEIVAKIAHMRLRIFEMGISYSGRTYAEGKKIHARDGFRALYCILRYNLPQAHLALQFLAYAVMGGFAALINLILFLSIYRFTGDYLVSAPPAFLLAAVVNYGLCVQVMFRKGVKWRRMGEIGLYTVLVLLIGTIDTWITGAALAKGFSPLAAKCLATAMVLVFNFLGRRFLIFPGKPSGHWQPQVKD